MKCFIYKMSSSGVSQIYSMKILAHGYIICRAVRCYMVANISNDSGVGGSNGLYSADTLDGLTIDNYFIAACYDIKHV